MMTSVDRSEAEEALALKHVAAAEQASKVLPNVDLSLAQPLERVAVVVGSLMGSGIAVACLRANFTMTLIEQDAAAADAAAERFTGFLDGVVKRGKLTIEGRDEALERLRCSQDMASAAGADLAIDAVFEDLEAKRSVFENVAAVLGADVPIATNTSYLDPRDIADRIKNPERILGLHFFSPAHIMKLVEIVKTPSTSDETLATAFVFAKKLGKVAVLSGICDGFIGNRMLQAYRRQADYMLIDGCLPHEIDAAMRAFGMPMGPYELQDLTGLQIAYANRQRAASTRDPSERYIDIGDRLCEAGRLGQRAWKGWYRYEGGDRTPHRDDEVERLIGEISARSSLERQPFSAANIRTGCWPC